MSKLLAVLVAVFAAAWFATPAFADPNPDGTYIQICKDTNSPTMSGPFSFLVGNYDRETAQLAARHQGPWEIKPGECTPQIEVNAVDGQVAVSEIVHKWFKITGIQYRKWNGTPKDVDLDTLVDPDVINDETAVQPVMIPVTAGGPQKTTIVHFTNDPVMGTLEICKYAQNGTNASGSFTFSISSPSMDDEDDHAVGWMDNLPAPPDQVVTIGSCSKMIPVPAGTTIIKEHPTNGQLFVTKINVSPEARFISKNIEKGKAVVEIWPNDAEHGETAVEFYNSLGTLKVCKVAWDDAAIALGPYPFYVNGATTPFTLQPNEDGAICHEVGQFAPGALTTVMEGVVPGTAVKWIKLNGFHDGDDGGFITAATDPKAPYLDVVNPDARTVAFYMRPGVNEIVFANDPAASVPLKVCKTAAGTATYSFSTSGLTGFDDPFWGLAPTDRNALKHVALTSFTVPTGQCKFVGYFPYNGTITVQETSGNLTNVAIDPLSTTAMLVGTPNYGARSANVYLGSYATWDQCRYKDLFPAVVNFTNGAALNPTPDSNPNPGPAAPVAQGLTTTPPAEATVVSTTPPTKVVAPAKVLKVASAKIVSVGKLRYVVVRVNGNTKMAHIHVTLIDKNHKVVGKVTRYVTTNKAVRVGNLTLKPSIVSVKVAL